LKLVAPGLLARGQEQRHLGHLLENPTHLWRDCIFSAGNPQGVLRKKQDNFCVFGDMGFSRLCYRIFTNEERRNSSERKTMNRRTFLAASSAAVMTGFSAGCGRAQTPPPNSKLCHACIGVGGMGHADLNSLKSHPRLQLVALCDVDKRTLEQAAAKLPGVRTYTDWRELLAEEGDRIDSVNVSTPDHMHASIALSALRARKHVYCQKPLCRDIAEIRAVTRAARDSGLVTQLGTQFASMVGDRMAVRYLRDGVLGEVSRVVLFMTVKARSSIPGPRPEKGEPAPADLNWDLWLGAAPERDYAPGLYHPFFWRAWQDFGTGVMGDNQSHLFDSSWKGLGLTAPLAMQAEVQKSWKGDPARRADNWPQSRHVTWTFPGTAKSGGKPLTVEWFDGMEVPEECHRYAKAIGLQALPGIGSLVIGSEAAMLMEHGTAPRLIAADGRTAKLPKPALPPHASHHHHWVDACAGGEKTESDFAGTGPMTEAIMLGNIAVRLPDTALRWDAAEGKVTNVPEANRYLGRTYREGWRLPGLG
jgi:predicted dehydrogenase